VPSGILGGELRRKSVRVMDGSGLGSDMDRPCKVGRRLRVPRSVSVSRVLCFSSMEESPERFFRKMTSKRQPIKNAPKKIPGMKPAANELLENFDAEVPRGVLSVAVLGAAVGAGVKLALCGDVVVVGALLDNAPAVDEPGAADASAVAATGVVLARHCPFPLQEYPIGQQPLPQEPKATVGSARSWLPMFVVAFCKLLSQLTVLISPQSLPTGQHKMARPGEVVLSARHDVLAGQLKSDGKAGPHEVTSESRPLVVMRLAATAGLSNGSKWAGIHRTRAAAELIMYAIAVNDVMRVPAIVSRLMI
jgi:hypothetical protein